MGKITFRADDALVDELESLDASKSEVMREALRTYLDAHASGRPRADRSRSDSPAQRRSDVGERVEALVDELVAERVEEALTGGSTDGQVGASPESTDVNITISLESEDDRTTRVERSSSAPRVRGAYDDAGINRHDGSADGRCDQCGEGLDAGNVYCPNCGEKASRRLFCECGDEIRSDWSFCPSCGRRTPAADVLDSEPV